MARVPESAYGYRVSSWNRENAEVRQTVVTSSGESCVGKSVVPTS